MQKNKTILIIPDIHGRDFWKDGVEQRLPGEKIIFLGDYTDPYPHEGIKHDVVPGLLYEILKVPDTILLLGNHDLSYIFPEVAPAVRKDPNPERRYDLKQFFKENWNRFGLVYQEDNVVFSHSGFVEGSYQNFRGKKYENPSEIAEVFQRNWENKNIQFLRDELFRISWYRGGYDEYGSCVWADVREHIQQNPQSEKYYQVFGHTMLKKGHIIVKPNFAMLDCQRPVRMTFNDSYEESDFVVL